LTVLADTGALYALVDRDDAWHSRVREWWERTREEVLVPGVVLPEIAYLLQRRIAAHAERERSNDGVSGWVRIARIPGDIYVSRMLGHEFGDPELVPELSSASHDEKPGIRFDGRQILIASDRPGTVGDVDIWIATRQGNGHEWGTPLNIVAINSTAGDRRPSFSPDGEMVLFDSDRPGGSGLFDLYVSTRNARPER
jgi:hypothetical protein